MSEIYNKVESVVAAIRKVTDFVPDVALVLGSGLGDFASNINVECEIPYGDLPGFPVSTVPGHDGRYIFGTIDDVKVLCMKGRVHYYEGYDISDVVLPIRVMGKLGAKVLFLTNAAGGVNFDFHAGDLMLINDHIASFCKNPLIGPNIDELGTRFPDMSEVYKKDLQEIIRSTAKELNIPLKEGVYMYLTGPSFESPAEIRMARTLGADAVGMSTVGEAIAANHMGMRVCGVTCVSNVAAGMGDRPLTHAEVQEAANMVAPRFKALLTESIKKMK